MSELRREDPPETRGMKVGDLKPKRVYDIVFDRLPTVRADAGVWYAVWDFRSLRGAAQWGVYYADRLPGYEFKSVMTAAGSTLYARYVGPPVEVPDDPDDDRPLGPDHPAYRRGAE